MWLLGINAYHGDASAALFYDGQLVAAAEEERFNRIKHSAGLPIQAIRWCLSMAGVGPDSLDHIAVGRNPHAHLFRKAAAAFRAPELVRSRAGALRRFSCLREDLALQLGSSPDRLKARFHWVEHHQAHLASAFFVSGFEEAAVLSVDGMGDFVSTRWGIGRNHSLEIQGSVYFPHSLGLAYTAVTQYLGFPYYGDEYKVMALAAYAQPAFRPIFEKILRKAKPGFRIGLDYFLHPKGAASMTWAGGSPELSPLYSQHMERVLGPARRPDGPLEDRHFEIASSLQERLEEILWQLLEGLHETTRQTDLCLAGGVAFNCSANGKILEKTPFRRLYIQPAAGDAGLAIGAACYAWHQILGMPRKFQMDHAYWGPEFSETELARCLEQARPSLTRPGGRIERIEGEEALCRRVADRLAEGKIAGWFQGRMEWGPRALGNRSILADPRRSEIREVLNQRVKHREHFRPFAPSILEERIGRYFTQTHPSPFMSLAISVRPEKRDQIPAVLHRDGTGRLQTVSKEANPLFWMLLHSFEEKTGVPVLLNTSFNDQEPIVCTPQEAIDCFLKTRMDLLVLGHWLVEKSA